MTITDLLPQYFSLIEKEEVNTERYKWEAIEHFRKHWNLTDPTEGFSEIFKRSFAKRSNLIFQNSYSFLNSIAKEFPETEELFWSLYEDTKPLEQRIEFHQYNSGLLLEKLKQLYEKNNIQHQQDERTIAFLLTLHDPEKYFLYKDNVYSNYCHFLGLTPQKPGKKYIHFAQLGEIAKEELKKDGRLYQHPKVRELIGSFQFNSENLLLQDIIYRVLVLGSKAEKDKEFMSQVADDVRGKLTDISHPLAQHKWIDNDATNFRQVSVFENYSAYPLHYEIMCHSDIAWEFHAEGNLQQKTFMEPFIQSYNRSKYKLINWKHGITKDYIPGTFHKVSPTKRFAVAQKGQKYDEMIHLLTQQFIALYQDTNDQLKHFLNTHRSAAANVEIKPFHMERTPLNQILYGPPGTGKTYSTILHAVSIVEGKFIEELRSEDIIHVKSRFDTYKQKKLIDFITFHQSYAYEEFLEGIKPVLPKKESDTEIEFEDLKYTIEDGVFKEMCTNAESYEEFIEDNTNRFYIPEKELEGKTFHKVSLGNTLGSSGDFVYNYCKENSCIAIGWGGDNVNYSGVKDRKEIKQRFIDAGYDANEVFNINAIERLALWMKVGDIVFVSHGNKTLKAVGIIEGEYEHRPSETLPFNGYNHFRKVRWLITDAHIPVHEVYYANFSQQSIYVLWSDRVKKDFFRKRESNQPSFRNHVLIIDEINRGNVSAIFGELITLIEEDKRLGKDNELTVTLPYSKEKFGVPQNLYIIGTMNTADRSVEALDTALRRRFSFIEMLPQPELLHNKGDNESGYVEGIQLKALLETINRRIEALIDHDHTIGHAYFMNVDTVKALQETFAKNIIPLLQEYFYGNYAKMEMVIGPYFFDTKKADETMVFAVAHEDLYDTETRRYVLLNVMGLTEIEFMDALHRLMDPTFKKTSSEGTTVSPAQSN